MELISEVAWGNNTELRHTAARKVILSKCKLGHIFCVEGPMSTPIRTINGDLSDFNAARN